MYVGDIPPPEYSEDNAIVAVAVPGHPDHFVRLVHVRGDNHVATDENLQCMGLVMGIALGALAAVAAYYLILNGFNRYDMALTSFEEFAGGAMIYIGLTYSIASAANLGCVVWTNCMRNDDKYEKSNMICQLFFSIVAPIAIILTGIICAIDAIHGSPKQVRLKNLI